MVTNRQLVTIKNKIIWLRSYRPNDYPCDAFMKWWDKHDPFVMEKQAKKLSFDQAYRLIEATMRRNWDGEGGVIYLWNAFTEGDWKGASLA